jgi:hypothetical protein
MSWEILANIGEFVSAIAVVISLVYLARQIRQNTRTVEASTYHAAAAAASSFTALVASSAELSTFYHQAIVGGVELDGASLERFDLLLDTLFFQHESYFVQHRLGMLPRASQERSARALRVILSTEGARAYWGRRRWVFTDDFVAYVERELKLEAPASA